MLVHNPDNGEIVSTLIRMDQEEIIPMEMLLAGDFDLALKEYQALKKLDPNDPTIGENNLNNLGSICYMQNDKLKISQDIFKINTLSIPTVPMHMTVMRGFYEKRGH